MENKSEQGPLNTGFFAVLFIAVILAGAAIKIMAPVLLPFTIALLFAFVLAPFVNLLKKAHIPRILSIILAQAAIFSAIYALAMILFTSGRTILTLYPKYENRLSEIYAAIAGFFELSYDDDLTFFQNIWGQLEIRTRVRNITLTFSNFFINFLENTLMVILFNAFLLIEADYFKQKILLAFEGKLSGRVIKISEDIIHDVSRYLTVKFFISLGTGIIVSIGLSLIGLEFPLLWGGVQFILNFIPNIGSIAVSLIASLFALLQFWPEPVPIVLCVLVMFLTNMIIGNILEPKIMGDSLGISPVVVLIALMLWGWLWGFAGMILAVPMVVVIKLIAENVPMLEPVAILLSPLKKNAPAGKRRSAG
jgi:predicted PurR-regulated permease PerM